MTNSVTAAEATSSPVDPAAIERASREVRRMGAQSTLMGDAVARHVGLNLTDLECLDLIVLKGTVTAGELARASGLTTGAVTALIDRLERKGYVTRTHDAADRRRVLVSVLEERAREVAAVYAPLSKRMAELWTSYGPKELAVIEDFARRGADLLAHSAAELTAPTRPKRL